MALGFGLSPLPLVLGLVLILGFKFARACHEKSKLKHIQTLGPDGLLTSYITAFRWVTKATDIIEEGYRLFLNGIYKLPTLTGWIVIANGKAMVDDIRKAPDEYLSHAETAKEMLHTEYTIHPDLVLNPYHISVIRTPLTRAIGGLFSEMHDEVVEVMTEKIPPSEEWVPVRAHETSLQVVVRVANRFLVGLPLCRESWWCDLNINFTISVVSNAMLISLFPKIFTSNRRSDI
ncbi:hypothetical protein D9758_010539 [Tetrapyrgos nigripes]|uniref:Cytochrome P450 n=1 Tax=Tetrapyrgos nigripes TaxID=182062 RepID=A0A8H5D0E2_9AGAR|nr:hypothetical protein D9758_010539 [Tetrapyrgos nigripes]